MQMTDLALHRRVAHIVVFKIKENRLMLGPHTFTVILKAQKSTKGALESENQ